MRQTAIAVTVILSANLVGCMSMTRGRSQTIEVQTNPPGARVIVRPVAADAVSPARISLQRKPSSTVNVPGAGATDGALYVVAVSHPGCKDAFVPIQSKVSTETRRRNFVWNTRCAGASVLLSTYRLVPATNWTRRASS